MNPSFDLVHTRWIPCVRDDGTGDELGLREVLAQAHELQEVAGESPLVTAALYRLLLAVLHRVLGPRSYENWGQLWAAGSWSMSQLDRYFERWRSRFDLFHPERPFYQAADARVKPKSVSSLVHDVASGNNATLFDHHTDAEGLALSPAQAARLLLAAQSFGLAGLSGLPQKFTDGPCARGIIFLVTGSSVFETLALNLVRYPEAAFMPHTPQDRPAWEMDDPFTPDRSVPYGYLDYLTWQNRRILLLPESAGVQALVRQMTQAPGLRLDAGALDPLKHYRAHPDRGFLPLRFTEGRALWRDSAALFETERVGDAGRRDRPPLPFQWLSELIRGDLLD
ncbi:MAG: type I-E CRISPR-associated protein Cse1/CasA, partial [Chloroflexi bacterium]|nr:type I-E CRISPR-associated protein Cse1/CasA [Chloroflexota bacterium]